MKEFSIFVRYKTIVRAEYQKKKYVNLQLFHVDHHHQIMYVDPNLCTKFLNLSQLEELLPLLVHTVSHLDQ